MGTSHKTSNETSRKLVNEVLTCRRIVAQSLVGAQSTVKSRK